MDSLKRLRQVSQQRQVEWLGATAGGLKPSLSFMGNEMAGEVGEACNVIKKIEREWMGLPGSRATNDDLAMELADVIITVDLIAARMNIDLETAVAMTFDRKSEAMGFKTRFYQDEK